jgi:DDE superfamily endonuclease
MLLIQGACRICFLSATYEGKWHDKGLADETRYILPDGSILYQDMGFQGFTVAGVSINQPKKKPKNGVLTDEEQEQNRTISRIRVTIEHVISSIKRYRIVKDKLRLWREHIHDMVIETCCGLHNFRLNYRPWKCISE